MAYMGKGSIVRSVWLITMILLGAQIGLFVMMSLILGVPMNTNLWFAPVAVAFHLIMGGALSVLRDLFRLADTGTPLTRVNVPNVLSMIRISSTPIILWMILIADEYVVVPYLASLTVLVFLTDLFDGQISRRTGQVTTIGKYLDSSSDYAILFATTIALRAHLLIHLWVFVLVLVRLGFQVVAQVTIFAVQRGTIAPQSSWPGKASVFGTMVLYAVALLQLLQSIPAWFAPAFLVLEIVVCVVVVISLGEKAYLFVVDLSRAGRDRSAQID